MTIPEILKSAGYVSGHAGKWHVSVDGTQYAEPKYYGFDVSTSDRGITDIMENRATGFATSDPTDPYRLDENGMPRDVNTLSALSFMEENKQNPFFLYYATWLVHAPIQMRCKELLEKYCERMNLPFPTDPSGIRNEGQNNPYYGAMVEILDYYVGEVLSYLRNTDDPRWKGHKLIDNTYIIFTSDNGGMEAARGDLITDNAPLNKGKINAEEGGIRVPFLISGPGIERGVISRNVINGLDILPTIASWAGAKIPKGLVLDGADLSTMLAECPTDPKLIKRQDGEVRNTIFHHFPHARMQSTIRIGRHKLIRRYNPESPRLELYELYDESGERVDIEEAFNMATRWSELADTMDKALTKELERLGASYPYLNPNAAYFARESENMCSFLESGRTGMDVWATYAEPKYKARKAYILYTLEDEQDWLQMEVTKMGNGRIEATLPKGTTRYIWGLVDDENFWYSYPKLKDFQSYSADPNSSYLKDAIAVK